MIIRGKIGYLTLENPKDRRSWSGTIYYMQKALREDGWEIVDIGPVGSSSFVAKCIGWVSRIFLGKRYEYKRSEFYARRLSSKATRRIAEVNLDCIVAPAASEAIAYLEKGDVPLVWLSDTTFSLLCNYYQSSSNFHSNSIASGNVVEKKAMEMADIVSFPSQWAADSAVKDYGVSASKIKVIPFGANFDEVPSADVAQNRSLSGACRMLFLGVDWERKGGDIAYETLVALEEDHLINGFLTVVGCEPPPCVKHERLNVVGFLDKNDPLQAKLLIDLIMESDYLLLPTRNECYGLVFCEASAYGLPSISTNTGGVSGVVSEGENGFLLPLKARGREYAEVVASLESDAEGYQQLCQSCRRAYDDRLNWKVWAREVTTLIEAISSVSEEQHID